jgi:uncharacterized membrane protein
MIGIDFNHPLAFALLALLPVFVLIDRYGHRARSTARRYTSLAIRLLGVTLLATALAGPVVYTGIDTLSTVFLLDRSASVSPAQQQAAVAWVQQAIQAKRTTDRAAVISFAADAAVEQELSASPGVIAPNAKLDTSRTNIAQALRLAEGVLPPTGARRIVLLTDGGENRESALQETGALQAAGIAVDVVPIASANGPEVAVRGISAPPALRQGERFTLSVTLSSTVETSGQLRLILDDQLNSTQPIQIHVGENNLVFPHDPLPPGTHRFQAIVEPTQDTLSENNVGYATVQVNGPAGVLLVEGQPDAARYLAPALRSEGLNVQVAAPSALGGDLSHLRQYDAIGLVNVPAPSIGAGGLLALSSYIHDFGGGLVAIGGDHSFGAGGYSKTPLEDALPLTTDVRARSVHPKVAVAVIVEDLEIQTSDDIAKETAKKIVAQLTPQDAIAVSDAQTGFPVPLSPVTDPNALMAEIDSLRTGDPDSYAPYLSQAAKQLAGSDAKIKHIILVGDGDAHDDYQPLVQQIASQGITVSTVATPAHQLRDAPTMQDIARWGRGGYFEVTDPSDVPQLVLKETTDIARPAITEEPFVPTAQDETPILDAVTNYPQLAGYVATTPKPSAVVGLVTPAEHDPLLAQWQYGLGHAVAFTSDAGARWSAAWLSWTDYSHFWAQAFKWAAPPARSPTLQVQTSVTANQAHIVVDAVGVDGRDINDAPTTATIASPTGQTPESSGTPTPKSVTLVQIAPGRYAADVPATQQGNYLVQVSQTVTGSETPATQTSSFSVPYSPEYAGLPPDLGLLRELAQQTSGTVLAQPAESFAHNLRLIDSAKPIWPYLIGALVPIFLLDVAARRLRVSAADLERAAARVNRRWRGQTGRAAAFAAQLASSRRAAQPAAPRPTLHPPSVIARRAPTPIRRASPSPSGEPSAASGLPAGSRLLVAKRRATPGSPPSRR